MVSTIERQIAGLGPDAQRQIRAAMASPRRTAIPSAQPPAPAPAQSTERKRRVPNGTEAEYAARFLAGKDARYEAVTLRMSNGHSYTPDWTYWQDGRLHAVEVKGSYKLPSYQRAKLAYDQARVEFPDVRFVWAVKQADGGWRE